MRSPAYLLVALLLCANASMGQRPDTVFLRINAFENGRIVLQKNRDLALNTGDTLKTTNKNWVLRVLGGQRTATIVLTNTDGLKDIKLKNPDTVRIENNAFLDRDFTLGENFTLLVSNNNESFKKEYELVYAPGGPAIVDTGTNNNPPNGDGINVPPAYRPGTLVQDALLLADANTTEPRKRQILDYYAPGITNEQFLAHYANNKFLDSLAKEVFARGGQQNKFSFSSILSSIGGLDVTTISDGFAKFLVKRVKQELSIAFFERFRKILESQEDLKTLFPETVLLLDAVNEEIYDYERYIQNLREAFKHDIRIIHHNLPGIIDNHEAFFEKHKEAKAALLSGCYVAVALENRVHPGDILDDYPIEYLDGLNKNFTGTIQSIQLLNASLRDVPTGEDGHYWVPLKKLRELVTNQLALKFFLGLVFQDAVFKHNSIPFENGKTLTQLLNTVAENWRTGLNTYTAYKRYVLDYGEKVNALNKMIDEYKNLPEDSAALEKYARYFRAAVDLIEYSTEIIELPIIKNHVNDNDRQLKLSLGRYFEVSYAVSDLVIDISKKNYSAAINEVVKIYNLVRTKPAEESKKKVEAATANVKESPERDNARKVADTARTTLDKLVKYGSFISTVAAAKNSDEVAEAIETAALPVGSSRIKRETLFNVALNAYVGPFIGYEKIKGVDSGKINSYGITAPIGVSVSRGHSILFIPSNTNSSSSIFFSLVDIGALTAFRFTNDSTEKIPTIELRDIVSPGIFFSHGFGKTPLSFNIGYQMGPLLRKVRLDENLVGKSYSRISISIVVDIPVFNFHSRSKP